MTIGKFWLVQFKPVISVTWFSDFRSAKNHNLQSGGCGLHGEDWFTCVAEALGPAPVNSEWATQLTNTSLEDFNQTDGRRLSSGRSSAGRMAPQRTSPHEARTQGRGFRL